MVVLRRFLLCTKWIDCNSSLSSGMDALQNQIPMPSDPEAQRNPSPFWATERSTNAVQTKPLWAGKIKMSSNRRTVVGDLFNRVDTCGIRPPSSFLFFFSTSTGTWQDGRLHLSRDPIRVILLCCECKTIHNIITVRIDACNGRMNSSCDVWHCTWIGCYLQNSCSLDSRKWVLFSLQFTCKLSL